MDTTSEKLFNDSYYNMETLNADECAQISTFLKLEDEDAVTPNWRPLHHGVPMTLTSDGFFCPMTRVWKSRTNLQWIDNKTPYRYLDNDALA